MRELTTTAFEHQLHNHVTGLHGDAVRLYRTDAEHNMWRFYRMQVRRDLFGAWCVIREWGRIGGGGQLRIVPFATETDAQEALIRQWRRKARRGYRLSTRI